MHSVPFIYLFYGDKSISRQSTVPMNRLDDLMQYMQNIQYIRFFVLHADISLKYMSASKCKFLLFYRKPFEYS